MIGALQPGEIVAGKYEVVRFLGKGGMGVVLEARHKKLDQRVALKLLLPDAVERSDAVARFEREARAAAKLRSQHVVRVLDVDNDAARGGLPFIVMEYLDGHDLAFELRRRQFLPVPEAVDIMLQACIALAEAHANGIVHRDIKPSNLFLEGAPHRSVVKVMDFGISKLVAAPGEAETELTTTETALGTPSYMAPEQLTSSKTIDHRADIWALGVVAYRMISGKLPFTADSPAALAVAVLMETPTPLSIAAPHVPPPLANAVMATLARDVTRRPQDAVALGRMLAPFGTGAIPFEASVAGLPSPKPRGSDPRIPSNDDATVRQSAPDVENPRTASAWSQRNGGVTPEPARGAGPIAAISVAVALCVIALVAGGIVLNAKRARSMKSTTMTSATASEASPMTPASTPATSSAADLPPPPSTAAGAIDEPASSASASASAAASAAHVSTRPVIAPASSPTSPRSATPKPAAAPASASAAPPKDPLHL